ncbi:diaminopimelate epimerase [Thermodesulfobacteriota bacterium]
MEKLTFYKMSGSGNDFIIIDNRNAVVREEHLIDFITNVCRRKMSVGADGVILLENSDTVDFKWRFYNSDGSVAEMCGNGARCVSRFAYLNAVAGPALSFETDAGIVSAQIKNDRVKIKMTDPADFLTDCTIQLAAGPVSVCSINTGVPHVIVEVDDLDAVDVVGMGREIRYHDRYSPAGTNVNFISPQNGGAFEIRTYERGVEDETLACGTGAVAGAIVAAHKVGAKSPVTVVPRSGEPLFIYYKITDDTFSDVYLEGDARIIYKGELWEDAWQ